MSLVPLPALGGRAIDAIVIGASAGGVEALSEILPALRRGAQVATMVVLHIPRERPSLLATIFADRCGQPVVEAQDKEPAQPGVIYFAPPDYHLLVDRSDQGPVLAMSNDELVNYSRPAIDVLFESAADVYRERLLGIERVCSALALEITRGSNDAVRQYRRKIHIILYRHPVPVDRGVRRAGRAARGRSLISVVAPRFHRGATAVVTASS